MTIKEKDSLVLRNVCPEVMDVLTTTGYAHVLNIEQAE